MLDNTNNYKEQLDDLQKISEEISDLIYDKKYNKIYLLDKKRKNMIHQSKKKFNWKGI